ncbi:MAG TPA: hypothetical protein VK191_05885 [Symbiobacteriaceae bacterium]|nr:hypothetical protein [Symbiobacteriaceae bacterium]
MRLIFIREAATLLGVGASAIRRRVSSDRQWVEIYGGRLRVYPMDSTPTSHLRFDADEINRLLIRLRKERPPIDR